MSKQIEALKLAMEALHGFIPYLPLDDEVQCGRYDKAITAIRKALTEQPAQEPGTRAKAIAECLAVMRPAVKRKFPQEQALEELAGYTSPQPSKPWVGLTEEDTRKINQEVWGYVSADHTRMWDYARAIEAKLKEKNA